MKTVILTLSLVSMLSFVVSCTIHQNSVVKRQAKLLEAYKAYYNATEALLDTLEKDCNWVDRFDPYEYYEAVENLK